MIKRLRRRIILLLMSVVSIVLAFSLLIIWTLIFINLNDNVQNSLENYLKSETLSEVNSAIDSGNGIFDVLEAGKICLINIESDGRIEKVNNGSFIDSDILTTVVGLALESETDFGQLQDYMLFYGIEKTDDVTRMVLADSEAYYETFISVLKYSGIMCCITLFFFFIFVTVLSSIFIAPIQKNWIQQKNFIADASHELKTPLTVILANCKILEAHPDETVESQLKWIKSTDEEATHMKELVNKLLLLAKNESAKSDKVVEPVNISDMAMGIVLQFDPIAYESGVTISTNIEKNIIINSDPTAVNQIIHILVDNAVKYAGLGGEAVLSLKKKNNNVFLYAKNTGEPISEEEIQHIFERFYRSDKARTAGNGYGLGLPICKSLVNGIGASISVTSDEENGTVFTVRFKSK